MRNHRPNFTAVEYAGRISEYVDADGKKIKPEPDIDCDTEITARSLEWLVGYAAVEPAMKCIPTKKISARTTVDIIHASAVTEVIRKLDVLEPRDEVIVTRPGGTTTDTQILRALEGLAIGGSNFAGGYSDGQLAFGVDVLREVWERSELDIPETTLGEAVLRRDSRPESAIPLLRG